MSIPDSTTTLLDDHTSSTILFVLVPIFTYFFWILWAYFASPLRKYPGPFLSGFTRLWYLYQAWTGDSHLELERLHKKHGPIVRISPDVLDIDIPEMIKVIYSSKEDWHKTEFYHSSSSIIDGKITYNLFSESDPATHAQMRKPIAHLYSPAAITRQEPHMDKIVQKLCHELETRFMKGTEMGEVCDLGKWISFYTWDVVGAVTFSKPIGYLDKGFDFDGTLSTADKSSDYFALVGTMPWLDHVFDKNPLYRIGPPNLNHVVGIAIQQMTDRFQGKDGDYHDAETPDFLDKFIEAKNVNPETVHDGLLIAWLMANLVAGADTTSITIRNVLYFSLRHPKVWAKLNEDIRREISCEEGTASYKQAKAIPYVDAVVREATRMLPGVAMTMERYVPPGGYTLPNGDYLPPGTKVGMSPYITNRNKAIFGEDSSDFRPERWLPGEDESEADYQARLAEMNRADLSFGAGARVCLGKYMGLFQTYKVLTTLVALYDIELATDKEWKVTNSWFPRQEGLEVRMRRRRV